MRNLRGRRRRRERADIDPSCGGRAPVLVRLGRLLAVLDALVFSGLWVAMAAAALVVAVTLALGAAPDPRVVTLAFAGTFAVYGVDRVRDHARDAERAPVRSAFVRRNRRLLAACIAVSGAIAAACALALGPRTVVLAGVAGAIGLLHRRLKERILFKAGYITAVWLIVVVGLPALAATPAATTLMWICALIGPSLLANAIAFNVRDQEALVARLGRRRALAIAITWAAFPLLLACFAPRDQRPLAAIPLATLLALLGFRSDERYAHVVVDGALLVGAVAACGLA